MRKPCLYALNMIPKTDTVMYSKSWLQAPRHVMERQTDEVSEWRAPFCISGKCVY